MQYPVDGQKKCRKFRHFVGKSAKNAGMSSLIGAPANGVSFYEKQMLFRLYAAAAKVFSRCKEDEGAAEEVPPPIVER